MGQEEKGRGSGVEPFWCDIIFPPLTHFAGFLGGGGGGGGWFFFWGGGGGGKGGGGGGG